MRLIDADELKKKLVVEHCDCEVMQIIDDMPFYTSLENYIEEHGEEIDFMFFAPELEQDGEETYEDH
jgi:hypothetical protein